MNEQKMDYDKRQKTIDKIMNEQRMDYDPKMKRKAPKLFGKSLFATDTISHQFH